MDLEIRGIGRARGESGSDKYKYIDEVSIHLHLIYINAEGVFHYPCSPLCDVCQGFLVNPGILHMQRVLALEESRPGGVQPVLVIHLGLCIATIVRVFLDAISISTVGCESQVTLRHS